MTQVVLGTCLGFGGFGATLSFVDFDGVNRTLTDLSREWTHNRSTDSFAYAPPTTWLGGHGGGEIGPVTLGGWGVATFQQPQSDSLGSDFASVTGAFEVGYVCSPDKHVWIRPCLDLAVGAAFFDGHSLEHGQSDFFRYFLGWQAGVAPGLELMGRIRYSTGSYAGLYVKAGYHVPFMRMQWSGDSDPPSFSLQGFQISAGLRFGRLEYRAYRI
jgi:hypothetical protein